MPYERNMLRSADSPSATMFAYSAVEMGALPDNLSDALLASSANFTPRPMATAPAIAVEMPAMRSPRPLLAPSGNVAGDVADDVSGDVSGDVVGWGEAGAPDSGEG